MADNSQPLMYPQDWIAAAVMTQRGGAQLTSRLVLVQAYVVSLPNGDVLPYRDGTPRRAFRSAGQLQQALASYGLQPAIERGARV